VIQAYSSLIIYVSEIPLVAAVLVWLVGHYMDRKPVRTGPWYVTGPAIVLVILSVFSSFWAVRPAIALETGLRTLLLFGVYILALNEARDIRARDIRLFLSILMAGLALQASVAVAQFINRGPLGLTFLGEISRDYGSLCRVWGLTWNPNGLAGFLAFILPIAFVFYLQYGWPGGLTSRAARASHVALLVVLAVGTAGLIVTGAHHAWAAWCLALGLILLLAFMAQPRVFSPRRVMTALLVMACVWGLFALTSPELYTYRFQRLADSAPESVDEETGGDVVERWDQNVLTGRLAQVPGAWQLISQRPLGGVGAGNYVVAFDLLVRSPGQRWPIHNVPLLVAAELGVGGGVCWLVLTLSPFVYLAARRRKAGRDAMLLGWFGVLVVLVSLSMFEFFIWCDPAGRPFLWAALGFWAGYAAQMEESVSSDLAGGSA